MKIGLALLKNFSKNGIIINIAYKIRELISSFLEKIEIANNKIRWKGKMRNLFVAKIKYKKAPEEK